MNKLEKFLGVGLAILILLGIGGYFLNSILVVASSVSANTEKVTYQKVTLANANPNSSSDPINLTVHDFLVIDSDVYPIIPSFFDLKLKVEITGDRCLEYVSQVAPLFYEEKEGIPRLGGGRLSALFLARQKGTAKAQIIVMSGDDKEVARTVYTVKIK